MIAEKVCRVCLNEFNDLKSLQTKFHNENKTIFEILIFVANIDAKLENRFPNKICNDCETDLNLAYVFKQRCLKSDALLCHYYETLKKGDGLKKPPGTFETKQETAEEIPFLSIEKKNKKEEKFTLGVKNCVTTTIKIETPDDHDVDEIPNFGPEILIIEYEENKDAYQELQNSQAKMENEFVIKDEQECTEKYKKSSSKNVFSCSHCDKIFHNRDSYTAHLSRIHNSKKFGNYECSVCLKVFTSSYNFNKHLKTHIPKVKLVNKAQVSCPKKTHIPKVKLVNKAQVSCPNCDREFKCQRNLTQHLKTVLCARFMCNVCGMSFPDQETLDSHKPEHLKDKYKQLCPICGVTLKTNAHSLLTHIRRHQNIKPFQCNECEKSFVTKLELKAHSTTHTGDHPYLCNICGRGFTAKGSLQVHRQSLHSGSNERPHKCNLCRKTFKTRGALSGHRHVHLSEKPYTCPVCAMAFRRNASVLKHLKTHAKDTPNIDRLKEQIKMTPGRKPVLAKTAEKDDEGTQEM